MNKSPSTALIVAVTAVAVTAIVSVTLILITLEKSEIPEGWLALFLGFLTTMLVTVAALAKVDKIGRQVDDLSNGKMDAKVRAAVSEVLRDELVDPAMRDQIGRDLARRDRH